MLYKIFSYPSKCIAHVICAVNQFIHYQIASRRNRYLCKIVGQRIASDPGNTIILYTILGKRDLYQISIRELMLNKQLIEQFRPCDAIKFGAIALGDLLFSLPEKDRQKKYQTIKEHMLG